MKANYFTILYWSCHTSTWIRHGCTHVPNPEPPFYLPPHTIPLGHPSAPTPSFLYPASNLNWRFVSDMILYMFNATLPNHPPLPPHTIPLGHPSAPFPSIQYPALNLDWWFVSYMILYMFQCHFIFDQLMLRKFFLKIMWSLFFTESLGSIWIVLILHPQEDNLMCLQKVIIVLSGLPFCSLFSYSWDNVVSTIFLWTT